MYSIRDDVKNEVFTLVNSFYTYLSVLEICDECICTYHIRTRSRSRHHPQATTHKQLVKVILKLN